MSQTKRSRYIPADERIARLLWDKLPPDLKSRFYKERVDSSEILKLFEWHHWPHAFEDGGPNEWWNLEAIEPDKHKVETAKQAKARAKHNRLTGKTKKRASKKIYSKALPGKGEGKKLPKGRKIPSRKMRAA